MYTVGTTISPEAYAINVCRRRPLQLDWPGDSVGWTLCRMSMSSSLFYLQDDIYKKKRGQWAEGLNQSKQWGYTAGLKMNSPYIFSIPPSFAFCILTYVIHLKMGLFKIFFYNFIHDFVCLFFHLSVLFVQFVHQFCWKLPSNSIKYDTAYFFLPECILKKGLMN